MQVPFTREYSGEAQNQLSADKSSRPACLRTACCLLACLLALAFVPGCSRKPIVEQPSAVDPALQPDTYRALARALSWNGNLHYQNFVIFSQDSWFTAGKNNCIARLDPQSGITAKLDDHQASQFAAFDRWLFYTVGPLNTSLRKIMTDGSNAVRISTIPFHYLIADQDCLYGIMRTTGQVMRIGHDGTGRQSLFDGYATEIIYDGTSLFICSAGDTAGLFRVNPRDGTTERLLQGHVSSLNKVGTRFYYIRPEKQNRVYLWQADTEQESRVTSFALARPFIIHDAWLYYLDTEQQSCLMRLPLKGDSVDETRLEKVVDDAISAFVILPDAIYYRRPDGNRIFRVPLPGGPAQRMN